MHKILKWVLYVFLLTVGYIPGWVYTSFTTLMFFSRLHVDAPRVFRVLENPMLRNRYNVG